MKRCVLIVDRDRGLAEAVQRFLNGHGIHAEVAHDGLQCVAALEAHAPAVVVLDPHILWGGADGVLEWLSHEDPLQPPAVILTEDPNVCTLSEPLRAKAACKIQRPASLKKLLPYLHQLIECFHKLQSTPVETSAQVSSISVA